MIRDGRSVAEIMSLGRDDPRRRRGHGGRGGDDRRDPGRGHVSRRHEAGHHPQISRVRRRHRAQGRHDSRRISSRSRSDRAERRPAAPCALEVTQPRRPADPGRIALPFLRGEPRARLRPCGRLRHAPEHRRPAQPSASSRATRARSSWWRSAARREVRLERPRQRPLDRQVRRDALDGRRSVQRGARTASDGIDVDEDSTGAPTPTTTARRPAIASGSRTPISSSASSTTATVYGDEAKFGGGKVIRDGMGQSPSVDPRGGRARSRHHERGRSSTARGICKADVGIRDGRICGHRQGGQSRHHGRRDARAGHRRIDRESSPAKGHILTAGAHRRARALHLAQPDSRRVPLRHHDADRRRHRPGHRHKGDDVHARRVEHPADVRGGRGVSAELRLSRQGQRVGAEALREQVRAGALGPEAARGLGHDAGGDRSAACRSPTSSTCRWPSTPTR